MQPSLSLTMLLYVVLVSILVILCLWYVWYRPIHKPTHAGGIVYKKEKGITLFLLVTSSANKSKWVLPKGKIEGSETGEFAAIREVMEEAGVSAKPVKKAGTVRYFKKGQRIAVVYFLMEFVHFYDTSSEGRKIAWLKKEEAVKRTASNNLKRILLKVKVH